MESNGSFTNQSSGTLIVNKSELFGIISTSIFTNDGDIVVGEDASRICGIRIDDSDFINNSTGSIEINRSTQFAMHISNDGDLNNDGDLVIGDNNPSGTIGLLVDATSQADNETIRTMSIEDVIAKGIENSGILTSYSDIDITLETVDFGILNAGSFTISNV